MPPIVKTVLALAGAVVMVAVAVFVRGRFDKHEEEVLEAVREYAHHMMTTPRTGR